MWLLCDVAATQRLWVLRRCQTMKLVGSDTPLTKTWTVSCPKSGNNPSPPCPHSQPQWDLPPIIRYLRKAVQAVLPLKRLSIHTVEVTSCFQLATQLRRRYTNYSRLGHLQRSSIQDGQRGQTGLEDGSTHASSCSQGSVLWSQQLAMVNWPAAVVVLLHLRGGGAGAPDCCSLLFPACEGRAVGSPSRLLDVTF